MKRYLFTIILLIAVGVVKAQTSDQQAEIDALNERIAKLEKRSEVWDKLKPGYNHIKHPPSSCSSVAAGRYLQG